MSEPIPVSSYESLQPGRLFASRYHLTALLGKGGFGKVFRALDQILEIECALKVLHPDLAKDQHQLARFKREVIIARRISHPNCCKIFDIGHRVVRLFQALSDTLRLRHSSLRSALPLSGSCKIWGQSRGQSENHPSQKSWCSQ